MFRYVIDALCVSTLAQCTGICDSKLRGLQQVWNLVGPRENLTSEDGLYYYHVFALLSYVNS